MENSETNIFLGKWEGILKQRGGVEDIYYFMLYFDKFENNLFNGHSHIKVNKTGDYGTINFTGELRNNVLHIQEHQIISQQTLRLAGYWCIKTYNLVLEQEENEYTLRGHWVGCDMDYPENRIFLEKVY